jgi:CRP-like cAMP-binding protein
VPIADVAPVDGSPPPARQVELQALIEASLSRSRGETAAALARSARLRRVSNGETIFRQGEEIPLTLMVRGHAGFRRTTLYGQQLFTGIAYPGQIFGITSISATISSVELVALTDGEVAMWRGAEFRRLVAVNHELAVEVIDRLASFLNTLTENLDSFLHQDSRRRVVSVLLRHRDLFFSDPPILSRAHLPGLVGTSREMTGRVLRQLEREGTLARVGRTGLTLLHPERLELDARESARAAS